MTVLSKIIILFNFSILACNNSDFGASSEKKDIQKNALKSKDTDGGLGKTSSGSESQSQDDTSSHTLESDPGGEGSIDPSVKKVEFAVVRNKVSAMDIVWLNDNSGSMTEEINQVRKNFERFAASLANKVDIKLTLVSSPGTTQTMMSMPPALLAQGHSHIQRKVKSNDALAISLEGLCPVVAVGAPDPCDGVVPVSQRNTIASLLRPNAKLVLIVVTDDDARGVTDVVFAQYLEKLSRNAVVFGFAGSVSSGACQIAAPGIAYQNLAAKTGGSVFNICAADWTPSFDQLVNRVYEIAKLTYTLPFGTTIESIKSVTLDGALIDPKKYKMIDFNLIFEEGTLLSGSKKIEVAIQKPKA